VTAAAHVVVTVAAIAANGFMAVADLGRARFVLANSASVGVPESWLTPLGLAKGAGAVGLAIGLAGIEPVGAAAALGLVLFFVGAIVTHVRADNLDLAFPAGYLALAAGSLALGLAT
jgi:DoxX-like family